MNQTTLESIADSICFLLEARREWDAHRFYSPGSWLEGLEMMGNLVMHGRLESGRDWRHSAALQGLEEHAYALESKDEVFRNKHEDVLLAPEGVVVHAALRSYDSPHSKDLIDGLKEIASQGYDSFRTKPLADQSLAGRLMRALEPEQPEEYCKDVLRAIDRENSVLDAYRLSEKAPNEMRGCLVENVPSLAGLVLGAAAIALIMAGGYSSYRAEDLHEPVPIVAVKATPEADRFYVTMSPADIAVVEPADTPVEEMDYASMSYLDAIGAVHTPEQAQDYLNKHFTYGAQADRKDESFAVNHEDRTGVCIDYAFAAATLLTDNGYTANFLGLDGPEGRHAVYLYRSSDGYGALGLTPIAAEYATVDELILALNGKYGENFDRYVLVDFLGTYGTSWIYSEQDLFRTVREGDFREVH